MRTITFYQARDEMNREFLRGSDMPGPTRAIFRYLVECTMFSGEAYGWVRHDACGVPTIAKITGFSVHTVKDHLRLLEDNGLIRRYRREQAGRGGRHPDEIRIEWKFMFEGAANERSSEVQFEGAGDEPSLPITDKSFTEPGEAGGDVIDMASRRAHA